MSKKIINRLKTSDFYTEWFLGYKIVKINGKTRKVKNFPSILTLLFSLAIGLVILISYFLLFNNG